MLTNDRGRSSTETPQKEQGYVLKHRRSFFALSPQKLSVLILAVVVLYLFISLFSCEIASLKTYILLILATAVAGWGFGLRVGLLIGLLSLPTTQLLFTMNGLADGASALRGSNLLGLASIVVAGMIAGYVHDMNVRSQQESSKRQILQDLLRRNEQWLKLLCERTQLGYQALTETGHLIEVNRVWLDMLGYTREKAIGQWFGDFLTPNWQDPFREHFYRFKATGELYDAVIEMVREDGTRLMVSVDGWVNYDESGQFQQAHCVLGDATERKRAKEALRAERDRAQQYLDIAGVMLVVLNADQTIAHINRKGCEILGYRLEKLIGRNWFDLFVPARVTDEVKQVFEALLSRDIEGDEYFEYPVVTQPGDERLIAWHITILADAAGHIAGMLCSGEDITERRQMEENLRKAHDELEIRVQERTSDLSCANKLLQQEIIERNRAEAAEKEQRVLAEALRDTASALNSTLNFEEVLDQILANLERVVQHRTGNIMLVKDDCVRIVRWRGYEPYVSDEAMQSVQLSLADPSHLRWMAETGQPLIIPDVDQYKRWVKLESSKWVHSYTGAPIRTGEHVIGFINLDSAELGYFKPIHTEGLRAFVDQAAIAIENARLYSRAQELAAVEERSRIAHDLHDAVSQTLWSACLIADGLPAVWDHDPNEGRQNLETLHQMTRGALAEMRALLLELRPSALAEVELGELLRQLTQAFTGRTRIPVSLKVKGRRMLPPNVQATLYRITQEALNNVARHAAASQVNVSLNCQTKTAALRISDNGCGFSVDSISPGHLGISIMRERAESIGASLKIDSQLGHGTTVEIIWTESQQI